MTAPMPANQIEGIAEHTPPLIDAGSAKLPPMAA
jgi:hypothetical protein